MAELSQSIEACIKTALTEAHALVRDEFAKVGDVAPPGSALDQNGLVDGDKIVLDYIDHSECGVAFEHLLFMVDELNLPISQQAYDCIDIVGRAMQMDSNKWSRHRPGG